MRYLSFLIVLLLPLITAFAENSKLSVQLKETKLRSRPQVLGSIVASLRNGEELEKLSDEEAGWLKVKTRAGATGFVHVTAVSSKKLSLTSKISSGSTTASASDVQNAAKGFDKETERQLAMKDAALNYSAVNAMEQLKVSQNQVVEFLKSGDLGGKL